MYFLPALFGGLKNLLESKKIERERENNRRDHFSQRINQAYPQTELTSSSPHQPRTQNLQNQAFNRDKNPSFNNSKLKPKLVFKEIHEVIATDSTLDIEGLQDPITGSLLMIEHGLYQCQKCNIIYQARSYFELVKENDSFCVCCKSTNIKEGTKATQVKRNFDFIPSIIKISNYHKYIGQVVTFEGQSLYSKESKRGNDFAIVFENKDWQQSLKIVLSKRVLGIRGPKSEENARLYIDSLVGKTIKVRGLLVNSHLNGYRIVVLDKKNILGVR